MIQRRPENTFLQRLTHGALIVLQNRASPGKVSTDVNPLSRRACHILQNLENRYKGFFKE